ncbi:unannotated protein [freshwater metagenome]|uniref:Unannotated protein n=1 Tax=freshwater metagenome TaxID=449393 RepID=A0A6J7DGY3_9ZZZZ
MGIVVDRVEVASANTPFKSRALFDDQRIGRDMVGLERDGGGQTGSPLVQSFARRSIDEIHRGLQPRLFRPRNGGADRCGLVGAVENRKNAGNRRLHPDRDAGDARLRKCAKRLTGHRVGVRFDGDLRAVSNAERRAHRIEHPGDVALGQQRRGASPDKHGRGWSKR